MEDVKTKSYEISFLANSQEDAAVIQKFLADVKAEIILEGPVTEIKLAYPINKKTSAFFGYTHFKLATKDIKGMNDALNLEPKIIRFLIITPIPEKTIRPRMDSGAPRTPRKIAANDLSNEALGEKLAALKVE